MPRYRKKTELKEDRPFRRRYKYLKHKHLTHVLKNAPDGFWKEVQATASTHRTQKHRSKLKPSSFDTIINTATASQFNTKLAHEIHMHDTKEQEFHKGGGLSETVNAVMSSMWDHMPSAVTSLITTPEYGEDISQMDRWNADVVQEAYNQDFSQRAATIHGWVRIPSFDSEYVTVYWDPAQNNVYAAVRGSITAGDWLYHDAGIAIDNHPGKDLVDTVRTELVNIAKEFPDATMTLNSHSLGGAIVTDSILGASQEETSWLDKYGQLNYYNAASSPIRNLDSIKDIVQDSRVKLFINRSDLINQGYNQVRNDDTRVSFGDAAWNPLTAHGMDQWGSGNLESDKKVNWGSYAEHTHGALGTAGESKD